MTAFARQAADREVERTRRCSEILGDLESATSEAVETALEALAREGAFRIHREWSASEERKLIHDAAKRAVSRALLESGWVDVSDEVRWLHRDRFADEQEKVAAQ